MEGVTGIPSQLANVLEALETAVYRRDLFKPTNKTLLLDFAKYQVTLPYASKAHLNQGQ